MTEGCYRTGTKQVRIVVVKKSKSDVGNERNMDYPGLLKKRDKSFMFIINVTKIIQ